MYRFQTVTWGWKLYHGSTTFGCTCSVRAVWTCGVIRTVSHRCSAGGGGMIFDPLRQGGRHGGGFPGPGPMGPLPPQYVCTCSRIVCVFSRIVHVHCKVIYFVGGFPPWLWSLTRYCDQLHTVIIYISIYLKCLGTRLFLVHETFAKMGGNTAIFLSLYSF